MGVHDRVNIGAFAVDARMHAALDRGGQPGICAIGNMLAIKINEADVFDLHAVIRVNARCHRIQALTRNAYRHVTLCGFEKAAVEHFTALVGTDAAALPSAVREAFVALGAAEGREERGPEVLLEALRFASRIMLRAASEALERPGEVKIDTIVDLSDAVTAYVDALAMAATAGYAQQVREQAGEGERRRSHLGELLLRGGSGRGVVREALVPIGQSLPRR